MSLRGGVVRPSHVDPGGTLALECFEGDRGIGDDAFLRRLLGGWRNEGSSPEDVAPILTRAAIVLGLVDACRRPTGTLLVHSAGN